LIVLNISRFDMGRIR